MRERSWSEFPGVLDSVRSATVLIRIPLRGVSVLVTDVIRDLEPSPELSIPKTLKSVHGSSFLFVASGTANGLNELRGRMQAGLPGVKPYFQVLDAVALGVPLATPKKIIRLNTAAATPERERVERAIDAGVEQGKVFAVDILDTKQFAYFVPREPLEPLLGSDLLEQEAMRVVRLHRSPLSWTHLLINWKLQFGTKLAVASTDWVILSASAFQTVQQLEAALYQQRPQPVNLDAELRESLQSCFSLVCDVPLAMDAIESPDTEDAELAYDIKDAAIDQIFSYLSDFRKSGGFSAPYGVRKAFINAGRSIVDKNLRERFIEKMKKMEFSVNEYANINNGRSKRARGRLAIAWLELLQARGIALPENPLTLRAVHQAIRELNASGT